VNITKPGAQHRSRKGLDCDEQGVCKGTDGFLIPVPDPEDPTMDWIEKNGPTYTIDWGENFGGGILEITVKTEIEGIEVFDTYTGKIEGEEFNNTFKDQITAYLEDPDGDQTSPTIRDQVGYKKFFRVIAHMETRYKHFYPSIYGVPKDAIYPRENTEGDGGFGVMQLTDPVPNYEQIWDYKQNIDGGVELIRSKLEAAEAYPAFVRTKGCLDEPKIINGKKIFYCFPKQKKDNDATDFNAYQLKMDTYSLYNSNWHYWKWLGKKKGGWQPRLTKGNAKKRTGSRYADEAEAIEKTPPSDF